MRIPSWLRDDPPLNKMEARIRLARSLPSTFLFIGLIVAIVTRTAPPVVVGFCLTLLGSLVLATLGWVNTRRYLRTVTPIERAAITRRRRLSWMRSNGITGAGTAAILVVVLTAVAIGQTRLAQPGVWIAVAVLALIAIGAAILVRWAMKGLAGEATQ